MTRDERVALLFAPLAKTAASRWRTPAGLQALHARFADGGGYLGRRSPMRTRADAALYRAQSRMLDLPRPTPHEEAALNASVTAGDARPSRGELLSRASRMLRPDTHAADPLPGVSAAVAALPGRNSLVRLADRQTTGPTQPRLLFRGHHAGDDRATAYAAPLASPSPRVAAGYGVPVGDWRTTSVYRSVPGQRYYAGGDVEQGRAGRAWQPAGVADPRRPQTWWQPYETPLGPDNPRLGGLLVRQVPRPNPAAPAVLEARELPATPRWRRIVDSLAADPGLRLPTPRAAARASLAESAPINAGPLRDWLSQNPVLPRPLMEAPT